jgi:putative DNA methylase
MTDDKRLIEDYLPIVAISAEASREKSVRKGHISTLHLWWARRPLVACRAAVYGALVPASQFVPNGGTDAQKKSLGRANAAKFITSLCQYPGSPQVIKEAQAHILKAHAERLSTEQGKTVTVEDIVAGRALRPRVLDMFAGGGAIPLEALRLGCEAYALDLNPVAHIIQLCTLVYPQKFGKPDPKARGMTGPKNDQGEATWGGLADEVRYWGNWVLEKVRAEIGDLYPPIPDPEFTPPKKRKGGKDDDDFSEPQHVMGFADDAQQRLKVRTGYLTPVAYLWTRTVQCKNPNCGATVPLVKQTWLCKKDGRHAALKMIAPRGKKQVRFEVVEARSATGLGFDPEAFSKAGNATCPFCGTVADSDYVKDEGCAGRIGQQMMAIVCTTPGRQGRTYLAADDYSGFIPDEKNIRSRIEKLCKDTGLTVPNEPIINDAKSALFPVLYGLRTWGDVFTVRQMLALLCFTSALRSAHEEMVKSGHKSETTLGTLSHLALYVDRAADHWTSLCAWNPSGEKLQHTYGRQALPMVWDFSEANPFGGSVGDWTAIVLNAQNGIEAGVTSGPKPADVRRGSATNLPWADGQMDAVITDPPYYDNVPYADISDFFYVWLKRTVGSFYKEHFATEGTPKKSEIVADAVRHGGDKQKAETAYEEMMGKSFLEANRVLHPGGHLVVVYAHKTTLGWATLVDALRAAGFTVTEAWPLDTEMRTRLRGMESAALASSIFLIARKREDAATGSYEQVRPELESIVRERVETLWDMGISGADLVIASVGAGLRAFTRFARVEYANGEEVPAERFLTEVETVVLETILARLSKEVGGKGGASLAGLDSASRFYILWRYTYGAAELDSGEAIIFANGTHVELDGQHSLTGGNHALVEKKKSKYRLRDFNDRGEGEKLGLPSEDGQSAPLVDTLHRTLWLMEKHPRELAKFLREAQPNREALRLVAQALAGPALKGGELGDVSPTAELSALGKLTANWQSVIEDAAQTTGEKEERKKGQTQLKV